MKITIPDILIRPDLATNRIEGARILLAFMYRIAIKGSWGPSTGFDGVRYYIHAYDVRMLLRAFTNRPDKHLECFDHEYFRIGAMSKEMWCFDWIKKPPTISYDLQSPDHCAIVGYLLAREIGNELVTDNNTGRMPKHQKLVIKDRFTRQFFTYVALKTDEDEENE